MMKYCTRSVDEEVGNKNGDHREATQQRATNRSGWTGVAAARIQTECRGIRLIKAPSFRGEERVSCPPPPFSVLTARRISVRQEDWRVAR